MIKSPKVLNHCFDTTNCSVAFSNSRNNGALPRMARQNMPEKRPLDVFPTKLAIR